MDENDKRGRDFYTFNDLKKIFNIQINKLTFYNKAEKEGIPFPEVQSCGKVDRRVWKKEHLPEIGKKFGFIKCGKNLLPSIFTFFSLGSGDLKSTVCFNIARLAALHGIKTCILGFDSKLKITEMLNHYSKAFGIDDLRTLDKIYNGEKGLYDVYKNSGKLNLLCSDISSLSYVPETEELFDFQEKLKNGFKKKDWLKKNVISFLKNKFDLIFIDCPSDIGESLLENILYFSDVVVSPISCNIYRYRKYRSFHRYIEKILSKIKKDEIPIIYTPTKFDHNDKLSREIYKWYLANIPHITKDAVKFSDKFIYAILEHISIVEYDPQSIYAEDMKNLMIDLFEIASGLIEVKHERDQERQKHKKFMRQINTNIPLHDGYLSY